MILGAGITATITKKTRQGLFRTGDERLAQYIEFCIHESMLRQMAGQGLEKIHYSESTVTRGFDSAMPMKRRFSLARAR